MSSGAAGHLLSGYICAANLAEGTTWGSFKQAGQNKYAQCAEKGLSWGLHRQWSSLAWHEKENQKHAPQSSLSTALHHPLAFWRSLFPKNPQFHFFSFLGPSQEILTPAQASSASRHVMQGGWAGRGAGPRAHTARWVAYARDTQALNLLSGS